MKSLLSRIRRWLRRRKMRKVMRMLLTDEWWTDRRKGDG